MFAASCSAPSQVESSDNMYGIDLSLNAVSAAPTRAVAPPKFQIDVTVFGEGCMP